MDAFRDEVGLFACAGHPHAVALAVAGLGAMPGRGGDGMGVAASDGWTIRTWRGRPEHIGAAGELVGRQVIGATALGGGDLPIAGRARGGRIAIVWSGRLANGPRLRRELEDAGAVLHTDGDAEVVLHLVARSSLKTVVNRIVDAAWKIDGGYALAVLTEDRVIALRDPRGLRPLVLGRHETATLLASEDVAIRAAGGEVLREVQPGEMVVVDAEGTRSVLPLPRRAVAPCAQELVALARSDAAIGDVPVWRWRMRLGERLAHERPCPRGEVVVGLPDAGVPAADGFAKGARLPIEAALVAAGERSWNAVPALVAGRCVVLVCAALVTGADVAPAVLALRRAGAADVHVRVASPPVRRACIYGVAGPTPDEIAQSDATSLVALTQRIGADSLGFLDRDALADPSGVVRCEGCFGGDWPVPVETDDQLPLFGG